MTIPTNAAFSVQLCNHIAVDVPCSSAVCLSVCLLVTRVDCVQVVDMIAMKFGGMVRIGPGHIARARTNRTARRTRLLLTFNHRRRLGGGGRRGRPINVRWRERICLYRPLFWSNCVHRIYGSFHLLRLQKLSEVSAAPFAD